MDTGSTQSNAVMAGLKRQRVRAKRGPMTGSARLPTRCPGHPRLALRSEVNKEEDVDARNKSGHDDLYVLLSCPNSSSGTPCACEVPIPPAIATNRRPPA